MRHEAINASTQTLGLALSDEAEYDLVVGATRVTSLQNVPVEGCAVAPETTCSTVMRLCFRISKLDCSPVESVR